MSNYSKPIGVDLREGGQVYISYEDMNGTGEVEIRWFQEGEEVATFAAPHYDTVLRLIEVLLWAAMAARKVEQEQFLPMPPLSPVTPDKPAIVEIVTPDELLSRGAKLGERFQIVVNGEIKEGLWESTSHGLRKIDPARKDDHQ